MNIYLKELSHFFKEECVLKDINCNIPSNKVTTILGRSGCGKTTLLNILAGLQNYEQGEILFNGQNQRPSHIGYMTQKDLLIPFKTVFSNLMLICQLQKKDMLTSKDKILQLLRQFNLEDTLNKYPRELSGGLRQRIHLLRQFLIDSPLLFLDEPFGSLDIITKQNIQDQLKAHMEESNKTVILVTHDIKEALFFSHFIIILGGQPTTINNYLDIDTLKAQGISHTSLEEKIIQALQKCYE